MNKKLNGKRDYGASSKFNSFYRKTQKNVPKFVHNYSDETNKTLTAFKTEKKNYQFQTAVLGGNTQKTESGCIAHSKDFSSQLKYREVK